MLVVLNHIDTVPEDRRAGMVDDVRRLLDADGLGRVPVLPVSARQGIGHPGAARGDRQAGRRRRRSPGPGSRPTCARRPQRLEAATGTGKAPTPVQGARRRARRRLRRRGRGPDGGRGRRATRPGCAPTARPAGRSRRGSPGSSPTRSSGSHLDLGAGGKELTGAARTSVPQATGVQRARVDTEVRALADDVGDGHGAAVGERGPRGLGVAAARPRRPARPRRRRDRPRCRRRCPCGPAWCASCSGVLILAALVGAGWLALLALGSYARLPEPPTPEVGGFPLPTLLLLGGIVARPAARPWSAGWLVALTRPVAGARGRQAAARRDLRGVRRSWSSTPIEAELAAYATVRDGLATRPALTGQCRPGHQPSTGAAGPRVVHRPSRRRTGRVGRRA